MGKVRAIYTEVHRMSLAFRSAAGKVLILNNENDHKEIDVDNDEGARIVAAATVAYGNGRLPKNEKAFSSVFF